jgi:hypothetical protein
MIFFYFEKEQWIYPWFHESEEVFSYGVWEKSITGVLFEFHSTISEALLSSIGFRRQRDGQYPGFDRKHSIARLQAFEA